MLMIDLLTSKITNQINKLNDIRNVMLYVFVLIVLAISWSSARTIQSNYELQKQITALKQQNQVITLGNQTIDLKNKYFQTDQYLELTARQSLGLAAPGETVKLVPKSVAMKYIDPSLSKQSDATASSNDTRSKYVKNLETWRDFLLGRNLTSD
jgi:cell division protein FtsB